MNRILPDGRKVFVYNDYPRFFDISFVFIGADRTAKVLVHISKNEPVGPEKTASVQVAVSTAPWWEGIQKTASISDDILKTAFLGKDAKDKSAEIDKEVSSIPDAAKAIPLMTKNEPDLSSDMLHALSSVPLSNALSTTSGLGMVLRPREFQRIILIRGGQAPLADALEDKNITFPQVEESTPCDMGFTSFLPHLHVC